MDTDRMYLAPSVRKCTIEYEVRKGKSGNCYAAKTVMVR